MAEFTIELSSNPAPGCPCCDPFAAAPQGYISRDDEPLALYFSDGVLAGPISGVDVTISLGRWGQESTPEDRRTASFRLVRSAGEALNIIPIDTSLSRWHVLEMLGRMLTAMETRFDPDYGTFRQLAETIARDDPRISNALAKPQTGDRRLSFGGQRAQTAFAANPVVAEE